MLSVFVLNKKVIVTHIIYLTDVFMHRVIHVLFCFFVLSQLTHLSSHPRIGLTLK